MKYRLIAVIGLFAACASATYASELEVPHGQRVPTGFHSNLRASEAIVCRSLPLEYMTLEGHSVRQLQDLINNHVAEGWRLRGGVHTSHYGYHATMERIKP